MVITEILQIGFKPDYNYMGGFHRAILGGPCKVSSIFKPPIFMKYAWNIINNAILLLLQLARPHSF